MEETDLLKELKQDEIMMTLIKPMKALTATSSILFDAKIVKDVYELNYVANINYLDLINSRIYLYLLCVSLLGYVGFRLFEEFLQEDIYEIDAKIKNKKLYK